MSSAAALAARQTEDAVVRSLPPIPSPYGQEENTMIARKKVGLVGLGVMGSAIGRRLIDTSHELTVFDVRAEVMEEFAALGAQTATCPQDVAACGVVVLSLNTADLVERVVFGPEGVLAEDAPDLLLIDMSSIDPGRTSTLAERASQRGARWVDAPLSGGAPAVSTGRLTLMVGGSEGDVAEAQAVLEHLAATITHLGPSGSGQLVKLVNQVLVGCGFAAIAEAASLVRSAGLDPDHVLTALTGGRADSPLLQEFFLKFARRDLTPTGRISNMIKDLETARDYARDAGVPLPITTAVSEVHRWVGAAGHGDSDNAALMLYFEPAHPEA
jgi:3-hydroxyisobutyrate dehydrogenase-like beta-hydroxyacid dehydrogenase